MDTKVVIGKIVAPHGVRGDFRILPLTETPELFLDLEYLYLENGERLTLTNSRFKKNLVLVSAKEIHNMDEAEKLRNQKVLVLKEDLPALPQGRFYVNDLKGFLCFNEQGEEIGTFQDTLQTGSTDVFVIKTFAGKELLVPAIKENILEIDTQGARMLIRPPQWLD